MQQIKFIICALLLLFLIFSLAFFVKKTANEKGKDPAENSSQALTFLDSDEFIRGDSLYKENCRTCHNIHKTDNDFLITGLQNGFWTGTKKIAAFLRNPESFAGDEYIIQIMDAFDMNTPHKPFPEITDEQVSLIYLYIMTEGRIYFKH